mmetsp:Transcript_20435/g.32495  ORF Transcript_20435/g.32495 Transcript_20435/m.32495 type:complete len:287 (+) Transcript_20435:41-901(+)
MTSDQQDCILLIEELPLHEQQSGIKLFFYIANKVLKHPNHRNRIYYDVVCKKFNYREDEFVRLLLFSGFKLEHKRKKVLIFDRKHTTLLRNALYLLQNVQATNKQNEYQTKQTSVGNHEECKEIEYELHSIGRRRRRQRTAFLCICNNPLIATTADIYGADHDVVCDDCFMQLSGADTIYHCSKRTQCAQHRYGYDLCECCAFRIHDNRRHIDIDAKRRESTVYKSDENQAIADAAYSGLKTEHLNESNVSGSDAVDIESVLRQFAQETKGRKESDKTQKIQIKSE